MHFANRFANRWPKGEAYANCTDRSLVGYGGGLLINGWLASVMILIVIGTLFMMAAAVASLIQLHLSISLFGSDLSSAYHWPDDCRIDAGTAHHTRLRAGWLGCNNRLDDYGSFHGK